MVQDNTVMALIRAYRPSFRNPHDKIAFALNATIVAAGYTLSATGDPSFSDAASPSDEEAGIDGWNAFDDCYGFLYTKAEKESKKSLLVKCLVMGDNLIIDATLGDGKREPINLQLNVNDFVSGDSGSTTYAAMYKNFSSLIDRLQHDILDRLEDKGESSSTCGPEAKQTSIGSEYPGGSSTMFVQTDPQFYPPGYAYPPVFPVGIDDLYPGPPAGLFPNRDAHGIGGGMLLGPNDPRWRGGVGQGQPGFPGGLPGVPPGARYDPIGPPDIPGFEPGRFVRPPWRRGGRGGHPDAQHFPGGPDYYI